jgi:kynureninase
VKPEIGDAVNPALAGWMGHEAPFVFDPVYRPRSGIQRMHVGTPPILSMAALDAALGAWDGIDMAAVRARSIELTERFIAEMEKRCPELELVSPRDPQTRGSQVSFRFVEGYAAMQASIANGVIGDFRAPDIMRFGFTPLYISLEDVITASQRIETVMRERQWERPEYRRRAKVT